MNIIERAFTLTGAVARFRVKVRKFFYKVMLMSHCCPKCDGALSMQDEGLCLCDSCGYGFDPTIAFQRCSQCDGIPILRVRSYSCKGCGADVTSKYLFDGLVFDREYFAQKMQEARQRKEQQRRRGQALRADNHSGPLTLAAADLNSVPGLVEALNRLTRDIEEPVAEEFKNRFDLNRYQDHVNEHIEEEPIELRDIPPLIDDPRIDLIWRFVATVFLEHYGRVDTRQTGQTIWVMKHDDRKGQELFDGFTETDGFEGSVG